MRGILAVSVTLLVLFHFMPFEANATPSHRKTHVTTTKRPTTVKEDESSEESKDSLEDEWSCGTDDWTKLIAQSTIDRDCPTLKNVVNKCCVNHDKCYDDQRGRKFCDDTFCTCLDVATATSPVCSKEDSPTFCNLVREFGEDPYRASAKNISLTSGDILFPSLAPNATAPEYDDAEEVRNTTTASTNIKTTRRHGNQPRIRPSEARYRRQLRLNTPTRNPPS